MPENTVLIPSLGNQYVDEVLAYDFTPSQDTVPQSATRETLPPLSEARIERALDGLNLNRNRKGHLYSVFSGEDLPADMTCLYFIEGEAKTVLRLLGTVALALPQEQWGHALLLSNEFNRSCRFGRSWLDIKDRKAGAKLYFDACIDFMDGVTDSYLESYILLSLFAAHLLFERTCKENLFTPARPKKRHQTNSRKGVAVRA